jgi:hypothetical protein
MKISLISWINNFLENRTFNVKIGDYVPIKYEMIAGVPQAAVLSSNLVRFYFQFTSMTYPSTKQEPSILISA